MRLSDNTNRCDACQDRDDGLESGACATCLSVICDLCGRWSARLLDGVCTDCRNRLKLDDTGILPRQPMPRPAYPMTPPYTLSLAQRVYDIVHEFHPVTPAAVEHIVTETMFQAAQDIVRGQEARLEYIGTIRRDRRIKGQLYVQMDAYLRRDNRPATSQETTRV